MFIHQLPPSIILQPHICKVHYDDSLVREREREPLQLPLRLAHLSRPFPKPDQFPLCITPARSVTQHTALVNPHCPLVALASRRGCSVGNSPPRFPLTPVVVHPTAPNHNFMAPLKNISCIRIPAYKISEIIKR